MRKITFLFLTTCLIFTNLTIGYTQDVDIDTLSASDVNADGLVNVLDLTLVAANFGAAPTPDQTLNPDVNRDGIVNILDLTHIARHLGKTVRLPIAFVSANPATHSQIVVDDTITLTFDNPPEDVTVNTGTATTTDKTVTIMGPFDPGPLALTITWKDGTETLTYTVRQPAVFVSARPEISTQIAGDATITLTFDHPPEDITVSPGTVTIADEIVTITGPFDPGSLALAITWKDGTQTLTYTIRPPAAFVSADPAIHSLLAVNDTITLTFDRRPKDVKVSKGTATTVAKTVRITGPFDPGPLALTIAWADGTETLTYTVAKPDTAAPEITDATVRDGEKDVDSETVNIEVTFNEEVSGNIELQTAAGVDVGWRSKVKGKKGTLELVKGKELGNEVTYVIAGKVKDTAGNSTDIDIRFTTASKTSGIPFEVTDATFNTLVLGSEVPVLLEYVKDG